MKTHPSFRSLFHIAGVSACLLLPWTMSATQVTVVIDGSTTDFETQRQTIVGSTPTTTAVRGADESLRVFGSEFIPNVAVEEGRPIFQFDLAAIAGSAPDDPLLQSATLRFVLLDVSAAPAFGVEAWGRTANLAAPVASGDPGAAGHYASTQYSRIHEEGLVWVPETTTEATIVSLDVTGFLADRYAEFAASGEGWVFIRLQADAPITLGSGLDSTYRFASASHSNPAYQPELELVLIPEPRAAPLFMALTATAWLLLRPRRIH